MRIVCDACATRYSIADEKVRGKALRMRCRRCGALIEVRAEEAPAPAPPAAAPASPTAWHLALPEGQAGPLTAADVRARLAAGEIDGETYAWRADQTDWLRLHAVADFAGLCAASPERGDESPAPGAALVAPPASAGSLGPPRSLAPLTPDLDQEPLMTGQRGENSLLFSLDDLHAIAAGARPAAGRRQSDGKAGGEAGGSGLIDLRAMAAQALATTPREAPLPAGFGGDALFASGLAAPVLLPVPPAPSRAWIGAAAACAAMLTIAVSASVYVLGRPAVPPAGGAARVAALDPRAPAVATSASSARSAAAGAAPSPVAVAAAEAAATATAAAAGAGAIPQPPAHRDSAGRRAGGRARPPAATPHPMAAATPAAATPAPAPTSAPLRPRRPTEDDALSALLNQASPEPTVDRRAAERRAAEADLPDQLPRGDILSGMRALQPQIDACFARHQEEGTALASLVLEGSGKARSARVGGALAATATAGCVEKALGGATFKRFKGAPMSLQFPFLLRQR